MIRERIGKKPTSQKLSGICYVQDSRSDSRRGTTEAFKNAKVCAAPGLYRLKNSTNGFESLFCLT